jgi:hypothetical protein
MVLHSTVKAMNLKLYHYKHETRSLSKTNAYEVDDQALVLCKTIQPSLQVNRLVRESNQNLFSRWWVG